MVMVTVTVMVKMLTTLNTKKSIVRSLIITIKMAIMIKWTSISKIPNHHHHFKNPERVTLRNTQKLVKLSSNFYFRIHSGIFFFFLALA